MSGPGISNDGSGSNQHMASCCFSLHVSLFSPKNTKFHSVKLSPLDPKRLFQNCTSSILFPFPHTSGTKVHGYTKACASNGRVAWEVRRPTEATKWPPALKPTAHTGPTDKPIG